MRQYSDKDLLQGIYSHNSRILHFIYREYLPYIDHFVRQHGGNSDEAKDVFQEGMLIVYYKLLDGDLVLNCRFSTYLYAVCRNIWLQWIKKRKRQLEKVRDKVNLVEEPDLENDLLTEGELHELFERQYKKLSPDCQRILRLFFNGCSMEEIRETMGYKSVQHAIDRKYRCNKSLISKLIQDPVFNELKNDIHGQHNQVPVGRNDGR